MKVPYIFTLMLLFVSWHAALGEEELSHLTARPPKPDEVNIGSTGVTMPVGRFVLVRRGAEYCAVKFTEIWQGETEEDQYDP
jgi:hypothetical protein